jgi:hypothetical protein
MEAGPSVVICLLLLHLVIVVNTPTLSSSAAITLALRRFHMWCVVGNIPILYERL